MIKVSALLFLALCAASPSAGAAEHLVSAPEIAERMCDVACPPEEAPARALLSASERTDLLERAAALHEDPQAAGVGGAVEGVVGFVAGFALVTLMFFVAAGS